jgi:hypothetical protein
VGGAAHTTFPEVRPRYNISPSQSIPVISESAEWEPRAGRDALGARPALVEGANAPYSTFNALPVSRGHGLVGHVHHKDPEPLNLDTVRGYVEHYQFRCPVAVAPDWQTLKRWWLDGHERSWTRRLCRPST